jgi:hypothetical protein
MGENNLSKNRIIFSGKRFISWKQALRMTMLVIAPLLFVLAINLLDVENIIQAKERVSKSKSENIVNQSQSTENYFNAEEFIAGENKYLMILSRSDLQDLEKKNIQEAGKRLKFDYSQSENLSSEEKRILEELTIETAGKLGYILGEPRYAKNVPVEIYFYSEDYLPSDDICTKKGGHWNTADSVCLSSIDASPINVSDKWNGSHVNKFSYVTNSEGNRVINSFESYRINLAIGKNNQKLEGLMNGSGFDCDPNSLQKTIAHELAHNYNSVIEPSHYDEAFAYYSSAVVQRVMADEKIHKVLAESGMITKAKDGKWMLSENSSKNGISVRDLDFAQAVSQYRCDRNHLDEALEGFDVSEVASSGLNRENFSDYQVSEILIAENEKLAERDLASCVLESYKSQIGEKEVFIKSFDFQKELAVCSQGSVGDIIQLSQSR